MKSYTFGKNNHPAFATKIKNEAKWLSLFLADDLTTIVVNGRDDGNSYIKGVNYYFGQIAFNHVKGETNQGYKDLI